jgi:hypothetical protein
LASTTLIDQEQQRRVTLADQTEPVKCPYNNVFAERRHPDGLNSHTCSTCRAYTRWADARRRRLMKTGDYVPGPKGGHQLDPELRRPVPKCGLYHPTREIRRACPRCKARARYTEALRRDARRDGQDLIGWVDAAETARHVVDVLVPSGLNLTKIADRAGVDFEVVSNVVRRVYQRIHAINAAAILSVQPLPYPQFGRGNEVNAAGTRRILRGLYAQGWTTAYMAELAGMGINNLWHWIDGRARGREREFVQPEMAETAKRLRDKLGPFDIAELAEPMDGMSRRVARRAAKRGWVVLADWDGLDIDDPRVTPHGSGDNLDASNGLVLVDPDKVERALRFRTTEAEDGTLTADQFPIPLTKMEFYEIVRTGSEQGHTGEPRVSANLLAQRLGVAGRTVQRCRAELTRAELVLDSSPPVAAAVHAAGLILATGEWPAGLRLRAALNLLAWYPLRPGFYRDLVVLGATQPPPYGRGWTDADLAAWLGCPEKGATALRSRAVLAGREYHRFRLAGGAGRPRNLGVEYPPTAA